VKTAGKIREAQLTPAGDDDATRVVPDVVQLPVLMEQDFGSMEGKKWYDRPPESKVSGKEHHRRERKHTAGLVDMESKDAMARRADAFLDEHLLPLLDGPAEDTDPVIAVVSHGIFLSTLWKRLFIRLPPHSITLSDEVRMMVRSSLEHLGGWSNTGYLKLQLTKAKVEPEVTKFTSDVAVDSLLDPSSLSAETSAADEGLGKVEVPSNDAATAQPNSETSAQPVRVASPTRAPRIAYGWTTTILTINGKEHLIGLKRTGGGVGSSRYDASQKSIERFFKRRKVN
jgi:hypothetical protein